MAGILDVFLVLWEVKFEFFPSLLWKCLFVPPPGFTDKDVGIGNFKHANINELGWGGGGAWSFGRSVIFLDGMEDGCKRLGVIVGN